MKEECDVLCALLEEAEDRLRANRVRIPLEVSIDDSLILGFSKVNSKWRIVAITEDEGRKPLAECTLHTRVRACKFIPKLFHEQKIRLQSFSCELLKTIGDLREFLDTDP